MNEETLKKLTGDIADESNEAVYRLVASLLVEDLSPWTIDRIVTNKNIKSGLKTYKYASEAVISFVFAVIVEFFPMPKLGELQNRFAYNLRVQAYEAFYKLLVKGGFNKLVPALGNLRNLIEDKAALYMQARGLTLNVPPASYAPEATAAGDGRESTAPVVTTATPANNIPPENRDLKPELEPVPDTPQAIAAGDDHENTVPPVTASATVNDMTPESKDRPRSKKAAIKSSSVPTK